MLVEKPLNSVLASKVENLGWLAQFCERSEISRGRGEQTLTTYHEVTVTESHHILSYREGRAVIQGKEDQWIQLYTVVFTLERLWVSKRKRVLQAIALWNLQLPFQTWRKVYVLKSLSAFFFSAMAVTLVKCFFSLKSAALTSSHTPNSKSLSEWCLLGTHMTTIQYSAFLDNNKLFCNLGPWFLILVFNTWFLIKFIAVLVPIKKVPSHRYPDLMWDSWFIMRHNVNTCFHLLPVSTPNSHVFWLKSSAAYKCHHHQHTHTIQPLHRVLKPTSFTV